MKQLYFIRHGLSVLNEEGLFSGSIETPLTDEGRAQAKAAGAAAKQLGIDHIISSPMSRAHETAQIIAAEIGYPDDDIELNSLLVERHFGVLEGTPYTPSLDLDVDGFADVELTDQLHDRVRLVLSHIESLPHDVILVVSHGSTGRMLRHLLHPHIPFKYTSLEERQKYKCPNGEIVRLV